MTIVKHLVLLKPDDVDAPDFIAEVRASLIDFHKAGYFEASARASWTMKVGNVRHDGMSKFAIWLNLHRAPKVEAMMKLSYNVV